MPVFIALQSAAIAADYVTKHIGKKWGVMAADYAYGQDYANHLRRFVPKLGGQIVSEAFPGCEVSAGPPSADNRSYRVSFTKIERGLPGFRARWTAAQGAAELRRLFERIEFDTQTFEFRAFTRLKQLKYLQRTGQVNEDLFWSER